MNISPHKNEQQILFNHCDFTWKHSTKNIAIPWQMFTTVQKKTMTVTENLYSAGYSVFKYSFSFTAKESLKKIDVSFFVKHLTCV